MNLSKKSVKNWSIEPRTEKGLLDQLLVRRHLTTKGEQALFLNPDYELLHDPFLMLNMNKVVNKLLRAIKEQQPVIIFGDYDHDGTPAAALLADGLTRCGAFIHQVIIPSRDDGYGLSKQSIDKITQSLKTVTDKQLTPLLITVDCGITNKPELDQAKSQGIDSIVIDHHLVQDDKFPDVALVINPKQRKDTYPFKELCGCGLAFKVIQALATQSKKISPNQLKWYLDLVAISTVCDMVPLVGENRILVAFGLKVLQKTKRPGLVALYKAAAIDPGIITVSTIGFGIGPRLNAAGRLDDATITYDLLVAKDSIEADQLAMKLEKLNKKRQAELERVLTEAESNIQDNNLTQKKVILVHGVGWPEGVVGLVAGRLMEKYHRPSIVLSSRANGLAKGSARSLQAFHIVEAFSEAEAYLIQYGGHARAAGLTLATDQIEQLYDQLIERADRLLNEADLQPKLHIDAVLLEEELTVRTAEELTKLEPHGYDNPKPVMAILNTTVADIRLLGSEKQHLKLSLKISNNQSIEAIGFGKAETAADLQQNDMIDVAGYLDLNHWNGTIKLQLKLVDWRPSEV